MKRRPYLSLGAALASTLAVACSAAPVTDGASNGNAYTGAPTPSPAPPAQPAGTVVASSSGELAARFVVRSATDFDVTVTRAGAPYVTVTGGTVERMYGFTVAQLGTPQGRAAAAVEAGRKDAAGVPAMTRLNETFFGVARQMGVTTPFGADLVRFVAKTTPLRDTETATGFAAQDANDNCHLITTGVSIAGGIACTIFTVGLGAVLCFGGTIAFDVISHYGCNHFYPPNQGGIGVGPNASMTPAQLCTALDEMNCTANQDINDLQDLVHACQADGMCPHPSP